MASVRPIPAAGRCRPTRETKKLGRLWADEAGSERDIDSIIKDECDNKDSDGDYEIAHTVSVAPLIVDAEGWPTEGTPGLSATAGG